MKIMSEAEEAIAAQFYEAIQFASNYSPRSQQSAAFDIGVSDIGTCHERARRLLAEIPEAEERDALSAFIGTAIGDHVEQAIAKLYERAITQARVTVTLRGDQGEYQLVGHPDIVLPTMVIDVKTVDGLELVKRTGSTFQQRVQRNIYALGAFHAGLFECPLEEVRTANVWVDRSGQTKELWVEEALYDPSVEEEATAWLDDVVYALANNETAQKDPPREWCAVACGHFADCRAYDTDVSGLITDPALVEAVEMHREGTELEKRGKLLKSEAQAALVGVKGNTGRWQVRWTHINESEIKPGVRRGYDRLNITKMK